MWQDNIFLLGNLLFATTLIPLLTNPKTYVPRKTSATTAAILYTYAATFATLSLPLSTAASTLTALLWTIVAIKRSTPHD